MKKPRATAATSGADRPGSRARRCRRRSSRGTHGDPFAVLGVHEVGNGFVARCFVPHAEYVTAYTLARQEGRRASRAATRPASSRAGSSLRKRQPLRYHARNAGGEWWLTDPYSFGPVLGPMDDYYIAEGSHLRLFDKLGAHLIDHEGAAGVHFAVWAPNARRVSVVGDFNDWDGRRHPMRLRQDTGIWEIFLPDIGAGRAYKYEIIGPKGVRLPLKADPFAFHSELRPATASMTTAPLAHRMGRRGAPRVLAQRRSRGASRSRSTRSMPAPGSATTTAASCHGTSLPTG